jgi:hypothetical protein
VHLFTVVLAVLFYWLLGFVIDDIGKWPGPDYTEIEKRMLDPALVERSNDLAKQIEETDRDISEQKSRQAVLNDSTQASQQTMNQLLEFQRLSLEKDVTPTEEEQRALAESQRLFLANQTEYQNLSAQIARLNERQLDLRRQQRTHEESLQAARQPVSAEYQRLSERHNLKIGAVKLAVLVPLLLVAVVLFLKMRGGLYAPMVYAFGGAVLLKVGLVMHEYFPSRYFKYVLILAALVVVIRALVYLLRMVAYPKMEWLLKQYREAYERFFCPVCEYPIRRGPLRYVFWSRRSIKKLAFPPEPTGDSNAPYTCPMCATRLFEECEKCHHIRHSLLPACEACGNERPVPSMVGANGSPVGGAKG